MGRPRILVVDDEAGIREGLELFLEREGYDVHTAGDAWSAVRWIKRAPLDCLLVDMDLARASEPAVNGLDLIVLLWIHQPRAKAILISASSDPILTQRAREWGVVAQLEKPVDLAVLTRLLRSLFPNGGSAASGSPVVCPSS